MLLVVHQFLDLLEIVKILEYDSAYDSKVRLAGQLPEMKALQ